MNEEIKAKLLKAGKIAGQVRREGALKFSKVGASYKEVLDYCEERIIKLGGEIAWAQMAVNDVAAHDCPTDDDTSVTKEGDVIKIDIGVHQDGWIADNAMTVEVGKSSKHGDLVKASQNALRSAIKIVRPGAQLREIGEAQASEAEAMGFKIVRNLCGHSIDQYKVHAGTTIPSFDNKSKVELQEGMQIAIEPFVTNGVGLIKEKGPATIFMARPNANARGPAARKVLEFVKPRNGLPFHTREITRALGKGTFALGIRELRQSGGVTDYPPLAEVERGLVSQHEHSMIVEDKPIVYTKHEDDQW